MPLSLTFTPALEDVDPQYWIVTEPHNGLVKGQRIREIVRQGGGSTYETLDGSPAAIEADKVQLPEVVSTDAVSDRAISAYSFRPVQTLLTADAAMPAVGSNVALSVESSQSFEVGDWVQLVGRNANGTTGGVAIFEVSAVSPGSITTKALFRDQLSFIASAGDVLPAGSELTGQTRLPGAPAEAKLAELFVTPSPDLAIARHNAADPGQAIALILSAESPQVYFNYRLGGGGVDIDRLVEMGVPLGIAGRLSIPIADAPAIRLFSAMPYRFRPFLKVIFR